MHVKVGHQGRTAVGRVDLQEDILLGIPDEVVERLANNDRDLTIASLGRDLLRAQLRHQLPALDPCIRIATLTPSP